MLQAYRYISARTLLAMPKLARCQSLPQNTWTSAENLWHLVFISHRWGSQNDPDPSGLQLIALKSILEKMVDIAEAISDDRVGVEAVQEKIGGQLTTEEAKVLILQKLYNWVREQLTRYLNGAKRSLIAIVENLWDQYAVSSRELEADREETLTELNDFLVKLGYLN